MLLMSLSIHLKAKDIDISKSKGTEQEAIISLTPEPKQINVEQSAVIKSVFNVELDSKHIKKHDIKLVNLSSKDKSHIEGDIGYEPQENAVTFTPQQPLPVGYYELEIKSLKADKSKKDEHIKEIKYRFYVPEVINGHMLPPEPNKALNNSTIRGIDANDNGVRDDVERWLIVKYAKDFEYPKTMTAIAMQFATALQYTIAHEPSLSYENGNLAKVNDAMDCRGYWRRSLYDSNELRGINIAGTIIRTRVFDDEFKGKIFNTRERSKAYVQFNNSLSGHMIGGGGGILSSSLDKCDADIEAFGEW